MGCRFFLRAVGTGTADAAVGAKGHNPLFVSPFQGLLFSVRALAVVANMPKTMPIGGKNLAT